MIMLSNTEAELNKSVAYRKSVYPGNDAQHCWSRIYDKHYAQEKIMQAYRIEKFLIKKLIEGKEIFLMDENSLKNKNQR